MTRYLTYHEALVIVNALKATIADPGLLDSALHRPQSGYGDYDHYPTIGLKAAALLHSVVKTPPLLDGNKRLGWLCAIVFLELNHHTTELRDGEEAAEVVLAVADGRMSDVAEIAAALRVLPMVDVTT